MGEVTPQLKNNMLRGVVLDDGPAKFESFSEIGGDGINRWYQVVVKEGRNREVRRIFESQGLKVSRLLRTRYGTVILPRELRTGRWMELDKNEIDNLAKAVELKPRQGTGLYGMAKRRNERMQEKPLAARRGGFLRQQRRDTEEAAQNTGFAPRERRQDGSSYGTANDAKTVTVTATANHAKTVIVTATVNVAKMVTVMVTRERRQDGNSYGNRERRQDGNSYGNREPRQATATATATVNHVKMITTMAIVNVVMKMHHVNRLAIKALKNSKSLKYAEFIKKPAHSCVAFLLWQICWTKNNNIKDLAIQEFQSTVLLESLVTNYFLNIWQYPAKLRGSCDSSFKLYAKACKFKPRVFKLPN